MTLKQQIIQCLEDNKGEFISGQALATKFNVTRTAIWKAIKVLKQEGYDIDSGTNKGYALSITSDIVSAQGIKSWLKFNADIIYYDVVDSTNKIAKKLAIDELNKPTVVVASQQTQGRGRRGRNFYSPKDSGIYISIALKPKVLASRSGLVTTMAAVAVSNAIDKVAHISTSIKWINDIYYKDRKICGILAEAIGSFESGMADYIIIGIGINITTDNFPVELKNKAGSICEKADFTKNELVGAVVNNIIEYNNNLESVNFLDEYRNKCFLLGKEVNIIKNDEIIANGKAIDIDDNGELIVNINGELKTLNNEEVSAKIN